MADIAHVVVLMLENRSFDSMLGRLYPKSPNFEGLSGEEFNLWQGNRYPVWSSTELDFATACIPTPDPCELFSDMNEQIFEVRERPTSPPTMGGFVQNYMRTPGTDPRAVMHGFQPEQVPVLSTLAKSFGVSDRWHASAPNQTWPNRFFAHLGTAAGHVNNSPVHFPTQETIFNRLTANQRSWRIYSHDIPQTMTLAAILSELPDHLYSFEKDFMADAMAGKLPNYSFIEPRYFPNMFLNRMPNDQHPPHDVSFGERLIARCYDALRNGAGWKKTLFIITYDEHGGIYDHVPPPAAVRPDGLMPDGFAFDRYGVRVPAVLVSPWIPPGSIVRPPPESRYPFDHTSILSTLRALFGLGAPLTERDNVAPDLVASLSLATPSNDGPRSLTMPTISASPADLVAAHQAAPNGMQKALAQVAAHLPAGTTDVPEHAELAATTLASTVHPEFASVESAFKQAQSGLSRFLGVPVAAV